MWQDHQHSITKLRIGESATLVHLEECAHLNGRPVCIQDIGDDGRVECVITDTSHKPARRTIRVKLCNLQHDSLSNFDVTKDMHLAFPDLRTHLVGDAVPGAPRIERPIDVWKASGGGVRVPCVAGPQPDGIRNDTHTLGATVDVTKTHLVLTLWTLLDGLVMANRVASIERVGEHLHASSGFYRSGEGWAHDTAQFAGRWLNETLISDGVRAASE